MSDHQPDNSVSPAAPAPLYEYVCHPAKRNTAITVLTTVFLIICVILVWLISFSPFMVGLSILILFGSLAGFYFPTRYYFYDDHLTIKTALHSLRKDWTLFRSFFPDRNGVLLSPFARPTRLENFRGTYVKFEGNRDKVMAIVRARIDYREEP
jgi:hypothetical protein